MAQSDWEKFLTQRQNAKKRGVEWLLSFDEWLDWWQQTGHYDERGRGRGKYVMARKGDQGPYQLGNIFCHLHKDNISDGNKNRPKLDYHKKKLQNNLNAIRKKCRVITPEGEFESCYAAGRHFGITGEAVMWRCNQTTGKYRDWIKC